MYFSNTPMLGLVKVGFTSVFPPLYMSHVYFVHMETAAGSHPRNCNTFWNQKISVSFFRNISRNSNKVWLIFFTISISETVFNVKAAYQLRFISCGDGCYYFQLVGLLNCMRVIVAKCGPGAVVGPTEEVLSTLASVYIAFIDFVTATMIDAFTKRYSWAAKPTVTSPMGL